MVDKRSMDLKIYDCTYEVVKTVDNVCIYCGALAKVLHHIPPTCSPFKGIRIKVPSCRSCNKFLSYKSLYNVNKAKEYLLWKYKTKFDGDLKTAQWYSEDLKRDFLKFVEWLKKYINKSMKIKRYAKRRIKCLGSKLDPEILMKVYPEEYDIFFGEK